MPFPRFIARANRYWANPVLGRLAGKVGPLAMLEHTGRRSGKRRQVPVMAFRDGDDIVIALTYGSRADWVRNILAAGHCRLYLQRQTLDFGTIRLLRDDPMRMPLPGIVRIFLRLLRVHEFLRLSRQTA